VLVGLYLQQLSMFILLLSMLCNALYTVLEASRLLALCQLGCQNNESKDTRYEDDGTTLVRSTLQSSRNDRTEWRMENLDEKSEYNNLYLARWTLFSIGDDDKTIVIPTSE
jgi:hypothetical protein